jgi:hypothetical protein
VQMNFTGPNNMSVYVQTIQGLDFDAYLGNITAYEDTIRSSIAATMEGVTADDVYDLAVTAMRRLTFSLRTAPQSAGDVAVSYTIAVHNNALTYASLSNQLKDAVSSGLFSSILRSTAVDHGTLGLTSASSDDVSVVNTAPTAVPTTAPTVLSADPAAATASFLSTGALVGIIVAAMALVGLLVMGS